MNNYSVYWGNSNNPYPAGSMRMMPRENAERVFDTMLTSVFDWVLLLDEHNLKIILEKDASEETKYYFGVLGQ